MFVVTVTVTNVMFIAIVLTTPTRIYHDTTVLNQTLEVTPCHHAFITHTNDHNDKHCLIVLPLQVLRIWGLLRRGSMSAQAAAERIWLADLKKSYVD